MPKKLFELSENHVWPNKFSIELVSGLVSVHVYTRTFIQITSLCPRLCVCVCKQAIFNWCCEKFTKVVRIPRVHKEHPWNNMIIMLYTRIVYVITTKWPLTELHRICIEYMKRCWTMEYIYQWNNNDNISNKLVNGTNSGRKLPHKLHIRFLYVYMWAWICKLEGKSPQYFNWPNHVDPQPMLYYILSICVCVCVCYDVWVWG